MHENLTKKASIFTLDCVSATSVKEKEDISG